MKRIRWSWRDLKSLLIFTTIFSFINAHLPQLYLHQGHISLQDNLSSRSQPVIIVGQPYTFEVVMLDTLEYDYIIESCVLNGIENFFDPYGCVHCTKTFVKVWETEGYGGPGSIKRTLVHLIAPSNNINIECSVKIYRCCSCAEKSCIRKPVLFALAQETIRLNYYCPLGPGYVTKDTLPFAGYIPPPPPAPSDVFPPAIPPPLPPAYPFGAVITSNDRSGYLWGLPWWLWLIFLLLLILCLLTLLALLLCLCCNKKKKTEKRVSTATSMIGVPPPPALTQTTSTNTEAPLKIEETKMEVQRERFAVLSDAPDSRQSRREEFIAREYVDQQPRAGYYDVNTGTINQGIYRKNRSRSPHMYSNGGFESHSREYDDEEEYYADGHMRMRRNSDGNYDRRSINHGRDRSYDNGYQLRENSYDRGGYSNAGFNYRSPDVGVVGLEGGFDEITRIDRDYHDTDDEYVVDKETRTTTTTKIIEERRVLNEDDAGYSTEMRPGHGRRVPGVRISNSTDSPSEENFREETVQRAVYAHSVPV